ncbi:MAG: septum formation initiator family protein [Chitinophagaceae bacterium]
MSIQISIRKKIVIVTTIFLIWIVFFAQYDIVSLYQQRKELSNMEEKIDYLTKEVANLQQEKSEFQSNLFIKEKYAREKYFMKKSNEEVYTFDTILAE